MIKSHVYLRYLGDVVPVGGVHANNAPIIPGEMFTEPLSGKPVRAQSGQLTNAQVAPSAGGYQALLDANVMACEARCSDAIREYKEALSSMLYYFAIPYHTTRKWKRVL